MGPKWDERMDREREADRQTDRQTGHHSMGLCAHYDTCGTYSM